jgi:hypothetical protein
MSRAKIALTVVPVALALAACGSASSPASSPTSAALAATPPAATSAPPPTATQTSSAGLSGTWNGKYDGSYSGTFSLTWQQSGSDLSGTIDVSGIGSSIPIHGTVNGSAISFGTVGSTEITYSGSVAGSSMSGTYQIKTASGSTGGSWSASKA